MSEHNRFSIAVAEELYRATDGDEMVQWHHASLFLVEENPDGGEDRVVQRLCFNNMNGWVLTPNVRQGFEQSAKSASVSLSLVPVLTGTENEIFTKWNEALRGGQQIKKIGAIFGLNFKESPTALNCRTGVKAVIESLGVPFKDEFVQSQAGTRCDQLSGAIIGVKPPKILTWDEICEDNADLVKALQL